MVTPSAGATYIAFSLAHLALFALSIVVCALYGVDLRRNIKAGAGADGRWIFAEVVAGLSALTSALYLVPVVLRLWAIWIWDLVLFVLWIALFGVFGRLYMGEDAGRGADVRRMKNAVWVDLACAILWFLVSAAAAAYWLTHRQRHTRFTGRAKV